MAVTDNRTPEQIRRDIETERERLADAVESLRQGLGEVTDVAGKLRERLPIVAAGALGAGFFLAGGIGATMRLLARRGREGRTQAKVGRFRLVNRD
jgi:Protein of unknown function (DUF3618)